METIKENLDIVNNNIEEIIIKNNITTKVKLLAVSKTFPYSDIIKAYKAGHRSFGENKIQEAESKKEKLKEYDIIWHLIGHLQSNKAKKAAEIFDIIHSIDKMKTLKIISTHLKTLNKNIKILIQINTSDEDSKSGLPDDLEIIKNFINEATELPNIEIIGLMTIGPLTNDKNIIRKSFIRLREIKDQLNSFYETLNLNELSMGMSSDYDIAIQEGATFIRVGSSIFGKRDYLV